MYCCNNSTAADHTFTTSTVRSITSLPLLVRLSGGPRINIPKNKNNMTPSLDTKYPEQHFNGHFQRQQHSARALKKAAAVLRSSVVNLSLRKLVIENHICYHISYLVHCLSYRFKLQLIRFKLSLY